MNRTKAESSDSSGPGYLFGALRLEPDGKLLSENALVALPPLELKALRVLLAHGGRVVSHAQLRQTLWDDPQADSKPDPKVAPRVDPGSLTKLIASLRARLEPHASIEAVYKRGYRLVNAQASPQNGGPVPALPRLAILPLSVAFGVPEYLGHAVAEEAAAHLSRARHAVASIVPHHSVFTLAHRGLSPQKIGFMLDADLVLTGTVRALPTHHRLEARMIRVSDGSQLWMADLLVEQKRLAGLENELADHVTFRLQQGDLSIFAEAKPDEPDADILRHEARANYQQAHQEWQTLERHHMQDALRRLTRAIELDPSLIAARVDLANLCIAQSICGYMSPANAAAMVKHAALPGNALPYTPEAMLPMLGWVNFHIDRDLPAALRAFALSADLHHDPGVTLARSTFALSRHRMDEAIEILRSAIRHDPWSPWLHGRLIWALHLSGQAEESITHAAETTARFPDHTLAGLYGAVVLAHNGDAARAAQLAGEKAQKSPYSDLAIAVHAYTLACSGREHEARGHLERLKWLSQERFVLPSFVAATHVVLGEYDAALEQLRAADRSNCPWFFQMLADPRLKPLHGHPEFKAMQQILPAMEAAARQNAAFN